VSHQNRFLHLQDDDEKPPKNPTPSSGSAKAEPFFLFDNT